MPIEINKKQNENFGRIMRRFNNAVQRSQVLTTAKSNRSYEKPMTKRGQKEDTLRQLKIEKDRREY